jgi:hypothetical protein
VGVRWTLAFVIVGLAALGCEEPEILEPGCLTDGDCANNEICEGAVCTEVAPCDNDPDGDGRGDGCPAGPDCDEGDANVFREAEIFVDADEDGVGVGPGETRCMGNELPAGFTDLAPEADDCDDEDPEASIEASLFVDGDGDGVGVGAATVVCADGAVPAGFTDVTPEADDCDDGDDQVFRLVSLATDGDSDGVGVGTAADTCIGEAVPAGFTENPVVDEDCDDGDDSVFELLSLHADSDNDGVGLGAVELVCTDGTVPVGFTDVTPAVADCDDFDAARTPGQPEVCDGLDNSCSGSADDEGVCPCPVIYNGDTLRPYLVCEDDRSWVHAEAACARLPHYGLVKIDDVAENDFIRANTGLDHWMGLNDRAVNGTFVWLDGTAPIAGLFDPGEPNNNGDCIYMRAGGWSDHPCEEHRGFICEADPAARDVGQACVDADGDGFGVNCLAGADCDDDDDQVYGWLNGFRDNDLDGFTAGHRELVCTDGALPQTFAPAASGTLDCDDTDSAVQAGCTPCNTYVRDDETYDVCFGQQNDWLTVSNVCVGRGGTLASLGTKEEADFFQDMVLAVDPAVGNWWFGMHDRDDLGATEGAHVWIDGTPVDALDFANGQPNNSDNQDCVLWQPAGWNDAGCGGNHRFVCER